MTLATDPFGPADHIEVEVLVIGSGLAGLATALRLAPWRKVALVTKNELIAGASAWAQGGIASVMLQEDSFESHANDTMTAGAGLCHADVVRSVVADPCGPDAKELRARPCSRPAVPPHRVPCSQMTDFMPP